MSGNVRSSTDQPSTSSAVHLRSMGFLERTPGARRWRCLVLSSILLTLFIASSLTSAGCDAVAQLTAQNQLQVDVTIVHDGINKMGTHSKPVVLGKVPAGQTV